MRKLKLYLDTSVISHLFAEDVPDKMQDTLDFWEDLKSGKYEIIISTLVLEEINKSSEPKRANMLLALEDINYKTVPLDLEIEKIAREIVNRGILTEKSLDDCRHIATAVVEDCSFIISWNFKHIVKRKTISGVREITISKNHRSMDIYSPTIFLDREEL